MDHITAAAGPQAGAMLEEALAQGDADLDRLLAYPAAAPTLAESGRVVRVDRAVATVAGLPGVGAEERVRVQVRGYRSGAGEAAAVDGVALNLDGPAVSVALLGDGRRLRAGDRVVRTGRAVDVPVGDGLLGRVIDATGRVLDGGAPLDDRRRWPIERPAPAIMRRAPVEQPLATGVKVIDALLPVGRGQRELILGDRQTGKTALALEAIFNQRRYQRQNGAGRSTVCVYCAIGQRASAVAKVVRSLREHGALGYCVVVVAGGDDPPGLQMIAPYAATSIAEYFIGSGRDALIVYDDLTRHARAYRELSLLLRRPPGREAYPGDIFYLHARLLERATRLRDGGALTALPILETEAQNLAGYVPTNLVSITDGQIYLSPVLFRKGQLPAVDVSKSVSRVGGKAQLPAYRGVSGALRLAHAQFEELEVFARFGTRLDERTRQTLRHGRVVRDVLRQPLGVARTPAEQVTVLLAAGSGLLDRVATSADAGDADGAELLAAAPLARAETAICERLASHGAALVAALESGATLDRRRRDELLALARAALQAQNLPVADAVA